ncbi:MAG: hypothetical protein DSZ05_00035 [Sulfurospirillum sp.]|nr:MAG: hypothetical protein DSZ05_00035 [Sulfurospirillum sp.]
MDKGALMGAMYHIQNAIVSMITPPGIFVILFWVAAFYTGKYRKFFIFGGILFYLLSTYYVGNKLVRPIENRYNKPLAEVKDADGIVLLGAGAYTGSSNLPVAEGSFKRVVYAVMLARKYNLPIIFSGANNEIRATRETLHEMEEGIGFKLPEVSEVEFDRKASILYPDSSANTIQNAMRAIDLFHEEGIDHPKIYLVTSAIHMNRAKPLFEEYGFEVIPAATDFRTRSDICYCFFNPSPEGIHLSYVAVHEAIGSLRDMLKRLFRHK